jgi:hypothetical protein
MDYGLYARSRFRVWGWLFAPLALILVLYGGFSSYYRRTLEKRRKHDAVMDLLPEMTARLDVARSRVSGLGALPGDPVAAIDELSRRLTDAARTRELSVESLNVKETDKSPGGGVPRFLEATLGVRGSLTSLMAFLNDLQQSERLMNARSVKLTAVDVAAEPVYVGRLAVDFGFMKL